MAYLPAWMFLALTILLMIGFPVTFTLMGTALVFGLIGFGWDFFNLLPLRIWGRMQNVTLAAVPLFVFMGVMLERSGLAEDLLDTMGLLFGRLKGGLAIAVVVVVFGVMLLAIEELLDELGRLRRVVQGEARAALTSSVA